jgi:hypothetical protein
MTFTDRERFIYHSATLMTLEIMGSRKSKRRTVDLHKFLDLIRNNRCRKLTNDDIDEIYNDIEEEVLLSNAVYDLQIERGEKNRGRKTFGDFFGV